MHVCYIICVQGNKLLYTLGSNFSSIIVIYNSGFEHMYCETSFIGGHDIYISQCFVSMGSSSQTTVGFFFFFN